MGDLAALDECFEHPCAALGHADRKISLKDYCRGLMLPIARDGIANHHSLHHFVAKSTWSDAVILGSVETAYRQR